MHSDAISVEIVYAELIVDQNMFEKTINYVRCQFLKCTRKARAFFLIVCILTVVSFAVPLVNDICVRLHFLTFCFIVGIACIVGKKL